MKHLETVRVAAAVAAFALGNSAAAQAAPFAFTLNGYFYGGASISGQPITDGTPFTETALFDAASPNLLMGVPGTAIYVPSQATLAVDGTTYQIAPFSAATPFGVAVGIFDLTSPFPVTPEYGVALIANPILDGAGILADFLTASPDFTVGNLTSTTFPASSYVGSGIFSGICNAVNPADCNGPLRVDDVEPIPLTANGTSYSLTLHDALLNYSLALDDPNSAPGGLTVTTPSSASIAAVPEPGSLLSLGAGLVSILLMRRVRRG